MAKQRFIHFGERIKRLRQALGLSQDDLGQHGFISTPGWIKIENGQRQASEQLIDRLTKWLTRNKHLRAGAAATLKEELLTLKYLGSRSPFVQAMARAHALRLPGGTLLASEAVKTPASKARGTRSKASAARR